MGKKVVLHNEPNWDSIERFFKQRIEELDVEIAYIWEVIDGREELDARQLDKLLHAYVQMLGTEKAEKEKLIKSIKEGE